MRTCHRQRDLPVLALTLGLASLAGGSAAVAQSEEAPGLEADLASVSTGVQASHVEADQDRDGGFERYRDVPSGLVLEALRLAWSRPGGGHVDLAARDLLQDDARLRLRAGAGQRFRLRFEYAGIPLSYASRATSLLEPTSAGQLRIADLTQQDLEDPDGNGIGFFSEPGGATAANPDNARVRALTADLLAAEDRFDLDAKRRTGRLEVDLPLTSRLHVDFGWTRHESRGLKPLGNGTYQRITDVDNDTRTDYDSFFSVRGVELAGPLDTTTDLATAGAQFRGERWFATARLSTSDFRNDAPGVTYDNPFWSTDTLATGGSRRGLWEQASTSLPPSNDAWNLALTAGFDLGRRTRLTATAATGEQNQDEAFLPITLNTALRGTRDLDGNGQIDLADDPTSLAALPRSSLDGQAETTALGLTLTSRVSDRFRLAARFRSYEYDGSARPLVIPFRAEYNDSVLVDEFHEAELLHVPYFFEHRTAGVEGNLDLPANLKLLLSWSRESREWNRYESLVEEVTVFTREAGNRSVAGTDDDTLGVTLRFQGTGRFAASLAFQSADRRPSGRYQDAYDGQLESLRQYDLAERERAAWEGRLEFSASERLNLGLDLRTSEDDYPDSEYGFGAASEDGVNAHADLDLGGDAHLSLWADLARSDVDMHLRSKCANCAPPAGADWIAPWGVPNFDWFTRYEDESAGFGAALDWRSAGGADRLAIEVAYQDATVRQENDNPGVPVDLLKAGNPVVLAALAVDFPNQANTLTSAEVRYTRRLRQGLVAGISYLYEDFDLEDFQIEAVEASGAAFLSVDDATRYLFLGAWNGAYKASVGQVFLAATF